MRPSSLVAALFAGGLAVTPALAAKPPPAKAASPYIDLQTVGFPAVVQGRLVNYIFATIRLDLAPGVDASRVQEQEPFLRDALVRAAAHTPFNPPGDGLHLDVPRLKAAVFAEAQARLGPGKVADVVVRSQTPQRRTGVPGPQTLGASGPG
jgi:hypothetical protein